MSHTSRVCMAASALVALSLSCAIANRPSKTAAQMTARPLDVSALVEPGLDARQIARRDLFAGPGGAKLAPPAGQPFHFEKIKTKGMSDNLVVTDVNGVRWNAKIGDEARTEVVASRILWAVGYHQPPVYHVPSWAISDGPRAGPQPPARFRPEIHAWKPQGEWAWQDNPFVDTRELNGLIVLMVLLNSWDLKTSNNAIYPPAPGTTTPLFVVKDLGETFGGTANPFLGNDDDAKAFAKEGFVKGVDGDHVRFDFGVVMLNAGVTRNVTVEDVHWICERLAALRDRQWQDAFRAGGYSDAEAVPFIAKLKEKVAEGLALRAESQR